MPLKMIGHLGKEIETQSVIVDLLRNWSPSKLKVRRGLIWDLGPISTPIALLNNPPDQLRVVPRHDLELVEPAAIINLS